LAARGEKQLDKKQPEKDKSAKKTLVKERQTATSSSYHDNQKQKKEQKPITTIGRSVSLFFVSITD